MTEIKAYILYIIIIVSVISCRPTKYVGESEYLLDKVIIKPDNKDVSVTQLEEYLRQTPNSRVFALYKLQLNIYNLSPRDTLTGWNRFWRRTFRALGEAPVIYDQTLTSITQQQLRQVYINRGYMNASVDTTVIRKGKKVDVTYQIRSNRPYLIGKYVSSTGFALLDSFTMDKSRSYIRSGANFDADVINKERERIAIHMRNNGYFNFIKDFVVFRADSIKKDHVIDLYMDIRPALKMDGVSPKNWKVFKKYYIGNVVYGINRTDLASNSDSVKKDTVVFRNYKLVDKPNDRFIALDALVHNTYIEPGSVYKDIATEKSYSSLNLLAPVKYVNISFEETAIDSVLDAKIYIAPSKTISVSAEIKGTLTKGYGGGEFQLGTVNKNFFGGAEALSIQTRYAFEKQSSDWAKELGLQLRLMFPKFIFPFGSYDFKRNIHANTEFTANISYQNRPSEFSQTNITGGMNYTWMVNRITHRFELFNLSYVYFPFIDPAFQSNYIDPGYYNKYNYKDHLIMRMGYNYSYSTFSQNRPLRNYISHNFNLESAGNFLYLMNKILKTKKEDDGYYKIFNVRYAQYVRGEYNTSYNQIFDKNNRIVYHLGIGAGLPFGNADIIPYERRFYSGGANSVRGWSESRLGPGVYQSSKSVRTRDYNQVGDLKLDMNLEYRSKLFWVLEGALFVDAGNIWTIKNYSSEQPGGQFKLNTFGEQIALAYGMGMRFDFSFFIFRLDMGVRMYDPARDVNDRWRLGPKWGQDFAFHLAVGYPF
ncbi:MAG: BamA/TamA family outer membrane protein [Paludibacter sp.]